MIYEIRAKKMLGNGSSPIGYYFYNKENADKKCKELNEMMSVYFVSLIEMKDQK